MPVFLCTVRSKKISLKKFIKKTLEQLRKLITFLKRHFPRKKTENWTEH